MVAWLAVAAAAACALGAAGPWARSGSADRSGYRLLALASALRVHPTWAVRVGLVAIATLPALAAGAWIAAALQRDRWVATLALAASVVVLINSVAVLRSPLALRWGVALSIGAAAVAAVAGVCTLAVNRGADVG
ncbi:MAG: hypothetical protein QOG03_195 [Actinomycetota bacterium]|nr:hypothetical protein [Actinomycetota bacterium]